MRWDPPRSGGRAFLAIAAAIRFPQKPQGRPHSGPSLLLYSSLSYRMLVSTPPYTALPISIAALCAAFVAWRIVSGVTQSPTT